MSNDQELYSSRIGMPDLINKMQSLTQAAKSLNLSVQRLRVLAAQGRIPGAIKSGSIWLLPVPCVITPCVKKGYPK